MNDLKKQAVFNALLSGKTQKEVADSIGISERTLYAFMKSDEYNCMLLDYKKYNMEIMTAKIQGTLNTCIETLLKIATGNETRTDEKIKACSLLINTAMQIDKTRSEQNSRNYSDMFNVFGEEIYKRFR